MYKALKENVSKKTSCQWLTYVSPFHSHLNSYVKDLTSRTSECDHILRWGLYKGTLVKMRSLEWTIHIRTDALEEEGMWGHTHTHTHRGEAMWGHEDTGMRQHLHTEERGLEPNLPSRPWEGTKAASVVILDFQPQNCEALNVCCWSHPVYGTLLWQH